mgnify:CR=1 FL=1
MVWENVVWPLVLVLSGVALWRSDGAGRTAGTRNVARCGAG